jgi:hypothetical protein
MLRAWTAAPPKEGVVLPPKSDRRGATGSPGISPQGHTAERSRSALARRRSASASQASDQFAALALAQAGHGLGRADLALREQAGDPRRTVCGQGEQERLHLLAPYALGRGREDVSDTNAAGCQRPLESRSADADLVRPAQRLQRLSGGSRGRKCSAARGQLLIRWPRRLGPASHESALNLFRVEPPRNAGPSGQAASVIKASSRRLSRKSKGATSARRLRHLPRGAARVKAARTTTGS